MDNPGIKNLGEKNPITVAVAGDVITLAADSAGTNQAYVDRLTDMGSATFFAEFNWGSGGTTAILVIDTSLDQGDNWIEIARFDFANADRIAALTVSGAAPVEVSTLAALSAEGKRDGFLGDRLRARLTTTGTYAGNTSVKVRAIVRQAGAAKDASETLAQYVDGLEGLVTTLNGYVDGLEGLLTTISGLDFASQTTLAAILAKIIAAPSTEAKQDAANALLTAIQALLTTQAGYLDGVETALGTLGTQTTLAAVLAKLSADPATQTTLAAVETALGSPMQQTGGSVTANIGAIAGREYETVAASQTAQVLGATGAAGDDLDGLLVIPASTSPGVVTILDNAISINVFAGGTDSVSNLVPFFIPLGLKSVSGAWKVTTGADVSVVGIGNFT